MPTKEGGGVYYVTTDAANCFQVCDEIWIEKVGAQSRKFGGKFGNIASQEIRFLFNNPLIFVLNSKLPNHSPHRTERFLLTTLKGILPPCHTKSILPPPYHTKRYSSSLPHKKYTSSLPH